MKTLPPRHNNDLSDDRKARAKRRLIAGVTPNTPNRKCVRQDIDTIPGSVRYYHVTRGWKVRKLTGAFA